MDLCKGEPFLDATKIWNTSNYPVFSACFRDLVIELVPCLWMFVGAPLYIRYVYCQGPQCQSPRSISWIFVSKMFSLTALLMTQLILLVKALLFQNMPVATLSSLLWAITLVLVIISSILEKRADTVRSMFTFTFWLLACMSITIVLYSSILQTNRGVETDIFYFVTVCLRYALTVLLFILNCFVDSRKKDTKNNNPELTSSALSWMSYTWLESLMHRGFRHPLTSADVYDLNPRDMSNRASERFIANWQNALKQNSTKTNKHQLSFNSLRQKDKMTEKSPLISLSNKNITLINDSIENDSSVQNDNKKHSSFLKCLGRTFWFEAFCSQIGLLIFVIVNLISPLLLGLIIDYTKDLNEPFWHGYIYASAILFSRLLGTVFNMAGQYLTNRFAIRIRSTVILVIFRKALSTSSDARRESTIGEIVNLMSVDANNIEMFINMSFWVWMSLILFGVAIFFLYTVIGVALFAGLGFITLMLVLNSVVMQLMRRYQDQMMVIKDDRMRMMNEVLNGIKVIKLYAWEYMFIEKILEIRNRELFVLLKNAVVDCIDTFAYTASTFWMTFFMLVTFVLIDSDHYLDANRTFVTINFINLVRISINYMPALIRFGVKAASSIQRIDQFLHTDDIDEKIQDRDENDSLAVRVVSGEFSWEKHGATVLKNINVDISPGKLVAVVGTVGSGKSSLLSAFLGEMHKIHGYCNINSTVAYVPQQAWIQNNSIRENILFGTEYDSKFYRKVVEACALLPDFDILPAQDSTEIGEKGINLSGGQKQRVSLARAVYSQCEVVLLDDPLSAVDSHVGKHIFHNVISRNGLLKHKTRVLVTHQLHCLPMVDWIIVMHQGTIKQAGTYWDLLDINKTSNQQLTNYIADLPQKVLDPNSENENPSIDTTSAAHLAFFESLTEGETSDDTQPSTSLPVKQKTIKRRKNKSKRRLSISSRSLGLSERMHISQERFPEDLPHTDNRKLIQEEELADGTVRWSVYVNMLRGYGLLFGLLTAVLIVLFHSCYNYANVWLSNWSDDAMLTNVTSTYSEQEQADRNNYYIRIFSILGVAQTITCFSYSAIMQYRRVKTSRFIHAQLLNGIMRAPMSFFDTTPIGRILNRFSQDLDVLDSEIFLSIEVYIEHGLFAVGIVIIISYTFPVFIAVVAPVIVLFYLVLQYYIRTSCQLRRIASNNRSPVYAHFSESLSGSTVIRAYKAQERFIRDSEKKVDEFQKAMSVSYAANKWIQTRLDLLSYVLILAATIMTVVFRGNVDAGLVGLTVTYALQITNELTVVTRTSGDLETQIVSVERMKEYSNIESEAQWSLQSDNLSSETWPKAGKIVFSKYSTRYRKDLDFVLRGVSFTIKPGEKVGIVGRTGAGKSSMVLSLFRLIEAAEGAIFIDNVDISRIGLHVLRQGLTILPQDPALFAGSLRMNLDPISEFTDDKLWQVLEQAHLKGYVEGLSQGLEHDVGEGGENLSLGQCQLVCLARTLLRKSKILVLDEATAAVDMSTDELIQKTIRTEFKDSTVLTIAHRLNTIMDYDRIMVLQNGQVAEFDSPDGLLKDPAGIFYSMAKDAGLVDDRT